MPGSIHNHGNVIVVVLPVHLALPDVIAGSGSFISRVPIVHCPSYLQRLHSIDTVYDPEVSKLCTKHFI